MDVKQRRMQHITRRTSQTAVLWLASVALLLTGLASSAHARGIPWPSHQSQHYEMQAEPLLGFLRRFFQEQSLRVVFSDALQTDRRTLNGVREGSPAQVARSIFQSNGLIAYYDGSAVHVYAEHEITHRYFTIQPNRVSALREALTRQVPGDSHNQTRIQAQLGSIEAIGVTRYLEQVQQLITAVARRDEPEEFRYVPLKYAWATDRAFVVGGQQITVPGLATLLRELIGAPVVTAGPTPVPNQRATSVRSSDPRKAVSETTQDFMQRSQQVGQHAGSSAQQPMVGRVVADPARNAIILRDIPARMRWYEELIQSLDVPTLIVEIEATIIDVNTDKLDELGVEWRLARERWEVMSADSGSKVGFLSALASDSVMGLQQLPGFQLGAIIGDRNQFISRLNLLEQDGVLKIASRPKVVTLNDLEAVIESSRTLYVPVQGAYEVDLFKVIAGTILRVTPHVINDGQHSRIRLMLAIEDGAVDMLSYGQNSSNVPVSTRHAVNTQAIINAGHSLLLGGLVRDEEVHSTRKVPLLGSLPVIGRLFRSEYKSLRKSERMFLISPRLVAYDGKFGLDAAPVSQTSQITREWVQQTCQGSCVEAYGSQGL